MLQDIKEGFCRLYEGKFKAFKTLLRPIKENFRKKM